MKLNKQQHEAFAKFFEAPTRERLRDVLKGNIGETDYLDFKREWPDNTKLAKHILALANSGGGAIIVGVDQKEDGSADSVGLPSLTDKDKIYKGVKAYLPAASFKERGRRNQGQYNLRSEGYKFRRGDAR